jgi:hypothetical protein
MLKFFTVCLTVETRGSRCSIAFGMYRGASVMTLRALAWNLSRISMLEVEFLHMIFQRLVPIELPSSLLIAH